MRRKTRVMSSIGLGAELDRPLYAAELFRGRFRRGGDASGIAPFRWEEIGPSSRRRFGPAAGIPRKCNKSQFTPLPRYSRGQCWKPTYEAVFASRRTTMRRFRKLTITWMLLAIGFSLPASDGLAQGSKELVGAWTLVSITQ